MPFLCETLGTLSLFIYLFMMVKQCFNSKVMHGINLSGRVIEIQKLSAGCKDGEFNWSTYVKNCRGQTAPKHLFKSLNTVSTAGRTGLAIGALYRSSVYLGEK